MKYLKKNILQNKEKRNNIVVQKNQVPMINQLYLDQDFEGKKELIKDLKKKISSYKMQDINKKRYTKKDFITYEELLEKLVVSRLLCKYCRRNLQLIYNYVREDNQWTLDRIDNNIEHTNENTNISCLKCNIQKGRIATNKFIFTKHMRIIKKF